MTLKEWIAAKGITQRRAAKLLKTDAPTLSRWLSETFSPNMKRAYQIEKITKGQVPMWTWVAKKPPYVEPQASPELVSALSSLLDKPMEASPRPQES